MPSLIDEEGNVLNSQQANLDYVHNFYSDIFSKDIKRSSSITEARAYIARIREPTIFVNLRKQLDSPFTSKEIIGAIEGLALGKTLGPDGLPNEFYKKFAEFLNPFLLMIWKETLSYGSLPIS